MIRKFYDAMYGEQKTAGVNGTFLSGIHNALQEQGQRLEKNVQRLVSVGNKLSDDSGTLKEGTQEQKANDSINPGSLRELQNDVDGFKKMNLIIEGQLAKLEKLI